MIARANLSDQGTFSQVYVYIDPRFSETLPPVCTIIFSVNA